MKFIDADYISVLQKDKLVRFKKSFLGENLSNLFDIKDNYRPKINLLPGHIGRVYQVRGGTIFIGFGRELNLPPGKVNSPTQYAAAVTLHINDVDKIQFEE